MEPDETRIMCEAMLAEHHLDGWTFDFCNSTRRRAVCKYDPREINISLVHLPGMTREEVRQTMLHEIAHALLPYVRGDAHGQRWQQKAAEIGYTGSRTGNSEYDYRVIEKSAARWRRNNGGDPNTIPPMRAGGTLFYKGSLYLIEKVNRTRVRCRKLTRDGGYWDIPQKFAALAMVS